LNTGTNSIIPTAPILLKYTIYKQKVTYTIVFREIKFIIYYRDIVTRYISHFEYFFVLIAAFVSSA